MRHLPFFLRAALLALATLQVASGAVLAVADGLNRAHDIALAPHAEDQGATHKGRYHSHDCIACRELRTGFVTPPAIPAVASVRRQVATPECAVAHTGATRQDTLCARAPPTTTRIG